MSINLIRYDAGAGPPGVSRGGEIVPLPGEYPTTADVLGEGSSSRGSLVADADAEGIDPAAVKVLHPVPQARVYCQGANYRSHMIESGMDPDRAFNMLFTKSTASLTGPDDDIVTPPHVRLLDYEVELGIVIGKPITGPVTVTDADLADYVGAFVLANDVSARTSSCPRASGTRARATARSAPSARTCVPDPDEVSRWRELRLTLSVNGEPRQDSLADDMVFQPAATLTEFSQLEDFQVGDLLLTGTPGGSPCSRPRPSPTDRRPAARGQEVGAVRPRPGQERRLPQARRPGHRSSTADGALDLGTQHNTVR